MSLLTEQRVRQAAQRSTTVLRKSADTVLAETARTKATSFDIFLSHSVKDEQIVLGALATLQGFGFSVYVDWVVDPKLNRERVTPESAAVLRARMRQCQSLLYLKTDNSTDSTWMPWELGYFDAYRGRVAILPVTKVQRGDFEGNEYLGLYPYVDVSTAQGSSSEILWVNRAAKEYGRLREWLSDAGEIRKRA